MSSLLWKLSAPDSPFHSCLFGTMHVRDRRAFHGLDKVYACLDACDAFALELDLDAEGPQLQWPSQPPLRRLLSPRAYARLRRSLLKAFQLDIAFFPHFPPFAVLELVTERILTHDHPFFLDAHLWNYAGEREKTRLGLETHQEQLEVLLEIPLDQQVKMLRQTGSNPARYRKSLQRMAAWYQAGDLKRLYHASKNSSGKLRRRMIYDRNQLMADRLAELTRSQSVFCAVGAAHLWGGKGLIRLLKQKGFSVKAVPL